MVKGKPIQEKPTAKGVKVKKKKPKLLDPVPAISDKEKALKTPNKITWPDRPERETTDVSFWWVWTSKCERYRVVRSIHKYDAVDRKFYSCLGKKEIISESRTLEGAFLECQRHLSKEYPDNAVSNLSLILPLQSKWAHLPAPEERSVLPRPVIDEEDKPKPRPIIPNSGNAEYRRKVLGEETEKEESTPKRAGGRPGVSKKILELLKKASKKSPATLEFITQELVKEFPDRAEKGLAHSAYVQCCSKDWSNLLKSGVNIQGNRFVGFWV